MLTVGEANQTQQEESPDSPPPAAMPRRAVPLTFNPIINDEANILASLARGDRTIPDLAEEHATTVTALCLWLQREDIQRKLNDLTTCGATLTRIAAVNQLPKAVSALSFQIDGYIFDRTHNLIKPGLDADRVAATRDANVRKAAHLMLRLARFDPNQPVYRRRERSASSILPQQGEVSPKATEGATAFSTGFASAPSASSSPALLPAPQPDMLDLCAVALSAASSVSHSEGRGRAGEPSGSPAISILQSNRAIRFSDDAPDRTHNDHANGRTIRHPKSSDSPPKSRPPPPD